MTDIKHDVDWQLSNYLSSHPFCSEVPYSLIEPLLPDCFFMTIAQGDVLLTPGQPNNNLYLLLEGQLKVHLNELGSEEGFLIQQGECVGELSIIDGELPSAYVAALTPCRILSIPENVLWSEFFQIPHVLRNFMHQIAQRFRSRNELMQSSLEQELRFEHLQKELSYARELQASMLPCQAPLFPNHQQVDVAATMFPAKAIGGDFYDAFPLDDQHVCISIGDVSGKGVPAALFMVKSLTLLRTELIRNNDLRSVIQNVNRQLCEGNSTCMFVTLLIVVVNVKSGEFQLVNGGHTPPIIKLRANPCKYFDLPKGILVGIDENADFESVSGTLAAGDALILYTDGVSEAKIQPVSSTLMTGYSNI